MCVDRYIALRTPGHLAYQLSLGRAGPPGAHAHMYLVCLDAGLLRQKSRIYYVISRIYYVTSRVFSRRYYVFQSRKFRIFFGYFRGVAIYVVVCRAHTTPETAR